MRSLIILVIVSISSFIIMQNIWGAETDCYWANPVNGTFGNADYWTPSGPPDSTDRAIFDQTGTYSVDFDDDYVNDRLLVDAGDVTLNLNSYTYFLEREWDEGGIQSVMIAQSAASSANLTITDGYVYSKDCIIGSAADASGELVIDAGAEWSALQHAVVIGDAGQGSLTVQNGGYLLHGHGWAGGQPNTSEGTITVTGTDSKWTVTGWFGLGQQGTAQLSVLDQGQVEIGVCQMANNIDAVGTALIEGSGSLWWLKSASEASLVVGNYGNATVTVSLGGQIINEGDLCIGMEPGSSGVVNVDGFDPGDGTPSGLYIGRELVLGWGGEGTFFVGNGAEAVIGGAVNIGPAGEVFVVNGLLYLTGSDPLTLNGLLRGNGVIQAQVENVSGIVNPSADPDAPLPRTAVMQIAGVYYQQSTAELEIDLAGTIPGDEYDQLAVSGTANLDGMLHVILADGFVPQSTDTFVILSAGTVSGTFANALPGVKYLGQWGRFDVTYTATEVTLSNYAPPLDCYWANPVNGTFGTAVYWTPSGPPELPDRAIFDQTGAYTVDFGDDHVNDRLLVDAGDVTLNLNGYTYSLEREYDEGGLQSVMIAQSPASTANLTVTDGYVYAKDCIIGSAADASGELIIDTGVEWSALGHAVVIGDAGQGSLTVQNGGYLLHGHGWAGGQPGTSHGEMTVSGLDSRWTVSGWFGLGQQGTAQLSVFDQGQVEMGVCQMGNGLDAVGTALIEGKGSLWWLKSASEPSLDVGNFGNATVTVSLGGQIINEGDLRIGMEPSSYGIVNVDGVDPGDETPSSLYIGRELVVGWGGRGDLNITGGGSVELHGICYVGNTPNAEGYILVNGPGSTLNMVDAGALVIGAGGEASLSISAGGAVYNINAMINGPEGSPAGVYLTDVDSIWSLSFGGGTSLTINNANVVVLDGGLLDNAGHIHMGEEASEHCQLHIQSNGVDGGQVHVGRTMIIGMVGDALVEVSGAGSELIVSGRGAGDPNDHVGLEVGRSSYGELYVANGAYVSNNYITTVGAWPDGIGYLSISGSDALLQANYQLEVGRDGEGTVVISDGGRLEVTGTMTHEIDPDISDSSSGLAFVGLRGSGYVYVEYGGVLTSVRQMQIGVQENSYGMVMVQNGGILETHKSTSATGSSGIVGAQAGSFGSVTVRDADSRWTQDGALTIGWYGEGELWITDGGLVESQKGIISRISDSSGSVAVSGADARWIIAEELHIGGAPFGSENSAAIMDINNGGYVEVGSNINIWSGGSLSIEEDANLGAAPVVYNPDYLHIDGGWLTGTGNINLGANRGLTIATGGATIEVVEDMTMRILGLTTGEGGLTKTGAGTLILAGTPSYLGATHIEEGWLRIETSADLHEISGSGNLGIGNEFVAAEVAVQSVAVNTLTIAKGSKLTIKPLDSGAPSGLGSLTAVPEPSVTSLLFLSAIAALFFRRFKNMH
jgi:T5SS/PEP-CTERM-associated repeat protein/autotransporter-associated beta strand protein